MPRPRLPVPFCPPRQRLWITALIALACPFSPALADTLRFAAQSDISTLDPHAHNERFNNAMVQHLYEPLALRDASLKIIPGLATGWQRVTEQPGDTRWRVTLRPGVRFHEGQGFDADDVVFSIQRAQHPRSRLQAFAKTLGQVRRIDALTVEFDTQQPNPLFVETLTLVPMMNRAWALAHHSETPADPAARQESHAHRHANGTGPFQHPDWKPDVSLSLDANPAWWGRAALGSGNVTRVLFQPIQATATRVAALSTGAVDLVVDLSPNDKPYLARQPGLKTVSGLENRIIYLGLELRAGRLREGGAGPATGNPLQQAAVRHALWQAIDYGTLNKQVLKGDHVPTGAMVTPLTTGYSPALDTLPAYDPLAAKARLAQAGYPQGFTLGLACPSDRHPVDELLCKALVNFWGKIGVQARLRLQPKSLYFAGLEQQGADVYLMGWGGATADAMFSLMPLLHSPAATGGAEAHSSFNYGGIADPALDALIDQAAKEQNPAVRTPLLTRALQKTKDEAYTIPLYRQAILWAMAQRVDIAPRADNRLELFRVRLYPR